MGYGIGDCLNYLVIANPVSQGIASAAVGVARSTGIVAKSQGVNAGKMAAQKILPLWRLNGSNHNFVRLAGLMGASAVVLASVGAHKTYPNDKGDSKNIFETANRFHFFHSIALIAVPLARKPVLSGSLMALGTALFSGTLYYRAFTGEKKFSKVAPIGGFCLILAWLTFLL